MTKVVSASELRKATPHDIMQSWQDGMIGYRQAMELTGCESLFELYQACRSSGVIIQENLSKRDLEVVERVLADVLSSDAEP